jgi:lysozyme family protein
MLSISDPLFQKYAKHILQSEGKLSKNPKDTTAAKMVPPGQVHTNRGVTWFTYRDNAKKLGLDPSYNSFITMGDAGAVKFIYLFYNNIAKGLPPLTSLTITEIGWASGPAKAKKVLVEVLQKMKKTVTTYDNSIKAAYEVDDKLLAQKIVESQKQFYTFLATENPEKYGSFLKGWLARADRLKVIVSENKSTSMLAVAAIAAAAYIIMK